MYYAIVDSESLNNPTILNGFAQVKVDVQYEPLSDANKYHHNFLLKFENGSTHTAISEIQKELKEGWFSFFWNNNTLNIVFAHKIFKISIPINTHSNEYLSAQKYGKEQGIQTEYLDYMKYFTPLFEESKKILTI